MNRVPKRSSAYKQGKDFNRHLVREKMLTVGKCTKATTLLEIRQMPKTE